MERGDLGEAGQRLTRAQDIVTELRVSLDMTQGPVAQNLASIYEYVGERLTASRLTRDERGDRRGGALHGRPAQRLGADRRRRHGRPTPSAARRWAWTLLDDLRRLRELQLEQARALAAADLDRLAALDHERKIVQARIVPADAPPLGPADLAEARALAARAPPRAGRPDRAGLGGPRRPAGGDGQPRRRPHGPRRLPPAAAGQLALPRSLPLAPPSAGAHARHDPQHPRPLAPADPGDRRGEHDRRALALGLRAAALPARASRASGAGSRSIRGRPCPARDARSRRPAPSPSAVPCAHSRDTPGGRPATLGVDLPHPPPCHARAHGLDVDEPSPMLPPSRETPSRPRADARPVACPVIPGVCR